MVVWEQHMNDMLYASVDYRPFIGSGDLVKRSIIQLVCLDISVATVLKSSEYRKHLVGTDRKCLWTLL